MSARQRNRYTRHILNLERLEDRTVPAYTATLSGVTATFIGNSSGATGNIVVFGQSGGLLMHNRGLIDAGFNSAFDFNSSVAGDQTLAVSAASTINLTTGNGPDLIELGGQVSSGFQAVAASTLLADFNLTKSGVGNVEVIIDDSPSNTGKTFNFASSGVTATGINVSFSGPAFGGGIKLNTGSGSDTVNLTSVLGIANGVEPRQVTNTGGIDTVTIGSAAGSLDGFAGQPITVTGNAGTTAVTVNDSGDTGSDTYTINATDVRREDGANDVVIIPSGVGVSISLRSGGGNDTFNVAPRSNQAINIDGGVGTNSLVIDLAGTTNPIHNPTSATSGNTTYGNRADVDYQSIQNFSGINGTFGSSNPGPTNLNLFIQANFDENSNAGLLGGFDNPDGEPHTVTIDFGDGSTPVVLNLPAGADDFQVEHFYFDDNPSGTQADLAVVSVTVTDGVNTITNTRNTLIHNVAPSNANVTATPTTAGSTSTITVTFTDPGTLDPHLIDIDFGDGSPVQSFGVAPGQGTFNKTHVYASQGTFTITATVHDDDLGTAPPTQTTVNVGNPDTTPPTIFSTTISKLKFLEVDAGIATLTVTLEFNEAMDTSINPILTFNPNVSSSFTLASSQWINRTRHILTYNFTDANVEVTTFGTITGAIDVAGNQMSANLIGVGITIDTVVPAVIDIDDGDADNVVIVNTPLTYTITFSENMNASLFTATDLDNAGTASISIGAITNIGIGVFTAVVTPTSAGTLRLRIPSGATVSDVAGNPLATLVQDNDTLAIILAVPVVTLPANQSGNEGANKLFNLGSITDANNSGNYTVTANWGDGTPNSVFNQADAGAIPAQSHQYTQDGIFTVIVTVSDNDGSSTPINFQANIGNVIPVAIDAPDQNAVATVSKSFALGSFSDPGADAPWHITVNWGDDSPPGNFTVNTPGELPPLSHTFPTAGAFNVVVTVSDDDSSATSDYLVTVIPPTADVLGNVFRDFNADGSLNTVDAGQAGVVVFADRNGNGILDANEPSATSDASGNYTLEVGFEGAVHVRQVVPTGFFQTTNNPAAVNVNFGDTVSVENLGNARIITPILAVGARTGNQPFVQVRGTDGSFKFQFTPFPTIKSSVKEVRLATGDANDDGIEDVYVVPGPGIAGVVKVFSGVDGSLIRTWAAYPFPHTKGLSIATSDITGDGVPDVFLGTDKGASPLVTIWDGKSEQLIRSFVAPNASSKTGVKVAAGDVNGDGMADVITTPGVGYDKANIRIMAHDAFTGAVLQNFVVKPTYRGDHQLGLAAGDLDGDGLAEVMLTSTRNGLTELRTFQNSAAIPTVGTTSVKLRTNAFNLAVKDINGDGIADLLFAGATGQAPRLKALNTTTGQTILNALLLGSTQKNGLLVG